MKRIPIVGITAGIDENGKVSVSTGYVRALARAGAVAIILAPARTKEEVWYQAQVIDGLVLSGGGDVSPHLYGQEPRVGIGQVDTIRDTWEIALGRQMMQASKPILGICRGMQIINIMLGGDVCTDLSERKDGIAHQQTSELGSCWHTVHHTSGSLSERLFGASMAVNSYHHQALRRIGAGLMITGMASDGVVESIESADKKVIGVQYHPELLDSMEPLWSAWVKMTEQV